METPTPTEKPSRKDKALEIIRSELNLEQWSIWQPSNSHATPKAKTLKREINLPDGSKVTAQVEVLPTVKGALTTEDQKTFYALIKQWEERGRLDTATPFSLQQLARLLKKKWGTRTIETLTQSLMRLSATSFFWTNSYYDSSTKTTAETIEDFRILGRLKIARRREGENITYEAAYFQFHDLVLANLQNNHTKPVLYDVAISFKSEIAQLLYGRIDRMLYDKTQYERRTKELFDDLGLEGKAYIYVSKRKQILEPVLKELVGKPLTTGRISSAVLQPTADKKDFKVVFRKGARVAAMMLAEVSAATETERVGETPAQTEAKDDPDLRAQGTDLVKHFFRVFHGADNAHISSKAIDQAVSLVAQHDYNQAKYIVDFAYRAAKETNFQIQTFGGVLQYEARAVAEYDEQQRRQAEHARQQTEDTERRRLEDAHADFCNQAIEAYLTEHHADQPARLEAKKRALLADRPTLYSLWEADTFTNFALHAIRSDIARELGLLTFAEYYEQHRSREVTAPQTDITNP